MPSSTVHDASNSAIGSRSRGRPLSARLTFRRRSLHETHNGRPALAAGTGLHARGRGKTRSCEVKDAACLPTVAIETPAGGRRFRFERSDQALIAAISGSVPRIAIIRFRL